MSKKIIFFTFLVFFTSLEYSFTQSRSAHTIYFKEGSSVISKNYYGMLNKISDECSSDNFALLKIFAFADTTGSENYNDKLSQRRAMSVYNYLKSHSKFDTTKIYITWLGESEDGYDLHVPETHLQLRCVDIWVYNKQTKALIK